MAKQTGEKTELASRKNADRDEDAARVLDYLRQRTSTSASQDIRRTNPGDRGHGGQRSGRSEYCHRDGRNVAADVLTAAAQVAGPTIPLANPTRPRTSPPPCGPVLGTVFAATKGQGRSVVLAVGPEHARSRRPALPERSTRPTPSSTGFLAADINSGANGAISGITVVMSAGLDPGTILMFSTAAARAFEYRYGNLQVVEPSVWGLQIGYAGDFETLVIEPTGVVKITQV